MENNLPHSRTSLCLPSASYVQMSPCYHSCVFCEWCMVVPITPIRDISDPKRTVDFSCIWLCVVYFVAHVAHQNRDSLTHTVAHIVKCFVCVWHSDSPYSIRCGELVRYSCSFWIICIWLCWLLHPFIRVSRTSNSKILFEYIALYTCTIIRFRRVNLHNFIISPAYTYIKIKSIT